MATIEKYVASQLLDGDAGGMPRPQISDALGNALQGLGGAIGNIAEVATRKAQQKEDFSAEAGYRKLQMQIGNDLEVKRETIAPDGTGFHDDFVKNTYTPARDNFLASVPERLREKYSVLLGDGGPDTESWSIKAAATERDQTYSWYKQELAASQEQIATAIAQDPAGYDKLLQQGFNEIDASGLPTPEKMAQRASWERMAQLSHLNRRLEIDPEGVLKDLGADPRYLSPTTQFDTLRRALIGQESGGDPNAVSPKGAAGVMQVMPGTARDIAKEMGDPNFNPNWDPQQVTEFLSNPVTNQKYGDFYLKKMIRQFSGRGGLEAALIGYNGGPQRAEAWIKSGFDDSVIPKESANYYKAIMAKLPGMKGAGKGNAQSVTLEFNRHGMKALEGQSEENVNPDLVNRVKTSFAALGIDKVRITSGFRSADDNRRVGGAKKSQHMHGNAMDIDVSGYSVAERKQLIQTLSANGITGLGIGSNIIHADLGGRRAWGYGAGPSGGSDVPAWAKDVIGDHLANKSTAPAGIGVGASGRYASLPYADRQAFIAKADQGVTQRFNADSKATAVQRVELKSQMDNELASLRNTGQGIGGFDDTAVSTVLGEDNYVKWANDKRQAQRTFTARDGLSQATLSEMDDRLKDYEPTPGSPTYADDVQVQAAVQKEIDKITKQRATNPAEAAMEFPDVRSAYEKVSTGMQQGNLDPTAVQDFVKITLDRQKEFNLKPGSEAPIPKAWAMEIGKSLSRIPEMAGRNAPEVNAAITAQYVELQKYFGDYTDEVILHALGEYNGVGKNTADLLTSYMEAISAGGDPLKLKPQPAVDRDQVESSTDGLWTRVKRGVGELWSGEPDDAGPPEPAAQPSAETVIRVIGALNGVETPEEEADIVSRYGQAAVDAAKLRIEAGAQ